MILPSGHKNAASSFTRYTDICFEQFFKRQLNIEDRQVMLTLLRNVFTSVIISTSTDTNLPLTTQQRDEVDALVNGFDQWYNEHGQQRVKDIAIIGDQQGLFGVPAYVVLDTTTPPLTSGGKSETKTASTSTKASGKGATSTKVSSELFFGQDRIDWVRRRVVELGAIDRSVKQRLPTATRAKL
jgi:2-hydroxychromene-2-carboxylate isomerase